jgi:hypothetical protein
MPKGRPVLYPPIPGVTAHPVSNLVSIGFRSRPVADAFGAPVLRDQGPIGRPGTARSMQASSGTAGYLSVWSSISVGV